MNSRLFWTAIALAGIVLLAAGWCHYGPRVAAALQAGDDPFGVKPKATRSARKPVPDDPFAEKPGKPDPEPRAGPVAAVDPFDVRPDAPKPDPPKRKPPKARDPKPAPTPTLGAREEVIEKALEQATELRLPPDTPLSEVVNFLRAYHGIQIYIDTRALGDVGVGTDTPITLDLTDVSLGSALDLMLGEVDLTWTIRSEVLFITTQEEAESLLITKVYDVADLVTFRDEEGELWEDYDTLIESIMTTINPTSWDQVGGPGSIAPGTFGAAKVIVVSQTYQTHRQIAELLDRLRAIAASHPSDDDFPPRNQPPQTGCGSKGGGCGCKTKGVQGMMGGMGGGCGGGMGGGCGGGCGGMGGMGGGMGGQGGGFF